MNFADVVECVAQEREFQRWKAIEEQSDSNKKLPEYLLLLESELNDAKAAFCRQGEDRFSVGHKLIQLMAVASEALEKIDPRWKVVFLKLSSRKQFDDELKTVACAEELLPAHMLKLL